MSLEKLRTFVEQATVIISQQQDEPTTIERLGPHLHDLVKVDDWLPEQFAKPHPQFYQQYLLHCDPLQRFSVVSFVWGPGQRTPIHDHQVWGLIGMLRGCEKATNYQLDKDDGQLREAGAETLMPGDVGAVSPTIGDIHAVQNELSDEVSVSIHVYGGNIGAINRHVFDQSTGVEKPFVSGFSSDVVPNIWS